MNRILSSLMVLMMSTILYSQPGVRREMIQDRVEAQRIAFITQKLQFTPDEAMKFWPIYNEYKSKQLKLRSSLILERVDQAIQNGGLDNLSDTEAEEVIAQHFALEENLLRLKREFYDQLKNAIPPRKIALLNVAEMEFNRTVLEQIRERMGERNEDGSRDQRDQGIKGSRDQGKTKNKSKCKMQNVKCKSGIRDITFEFYIYYFTF